MIAEIVLSVLAGGLVKLCDSIADDKLKIWGGYLFAAFYGVIIAYISTQTPLSSLWLGAVIAMALMGKIDDYMHVLAVLIVAAAVLIFSVTSFNLGYFLLFTAAAAADEMRFKKKSILSQLSSNRLWLDIVAFLASLISGYLLYFFSIAFFDIAYYLMGNILVKLYPTKARR